MKDHQPDLMTPRLKLRPFVDSDRPFVFKGLSNTEVVRYYGVRYTTLEDTEMQMEWFASMRAEGTGAWWLITDHADHDPMGAVGINSIHPLHRKAEMGFWLLPEYWGRDFVQEAGEAVLQFAFDTLNLHRIEALVETENERSKKVLRKLDFQLEGMMKDCERKGNQWVSLEMYARLKNP